MLPMLRPVVTTTLGLLVSNLAVPCLAQFPRTEGLNLTHIVSPIDPNIKITFKVPKGACTTAFDRQEQYTGWVTVPGTYDANIFFWFVAAREPTSLLTIWLNGGPGSSSMFGLFTETGPCEVIEKGANRLGTAAREWGWDRASNMLFIDQPNQVGFSYDIPTNGTLDLFRENIDVPPLPANRGANPLLLNGTFSSQSVNATANTTDLAATAIYHMMQGFLATFPQFNPPANTSLGVNLFAESYGGKYGPTFFDVWEGENEKRKNGTTPAASTVDIHLTALGIVNGCIDDLIQGPYYASMMVNNSYGFKAVPPLQANLVNASFYQPNGCRDQIQQCRTAVQVKEPNNQAKVNELCSKAQSVCTTQLLDPYGNAGRSYYDIGHDVPESFPPMFYQEYLNTHEVQTAIGSVVNYTDSSSAVYAAFSSTGDWERDQMIPKLSSLLRSGIRIGLVYGDRDFICNWLGGEAVSLSIAQSAGPSYQAHFASAGYAPIIVNDSYIGGVVRQYGNLSFSRVYQAGHFVPAYQPETAFQVFARIVMGTSVSTGAAINITSYNTTGPLNATATMKLPENTEGPCFLRALGTSCDEDQIDSLHDGKGVIINGAWYPASSDWPGAAKTGAPTEVASSVTPTLTGLFTATATPQNRGSRSIEGQPIRLMFTVVAMMTLVVSAL